VAAISLMFEQNTVILWEKFKSLVSPLLNRLQSGQGISGYKIIKVPTPEDKTKLAAIIRIYPIYAIESFEITI